MYLTAEFLLDVVHYSDPTVSLKCISLILSLSRSRSLSLALKLYRTLGIRVVLVGLEIWNHKNYINLDPNSETTLDRFLLWRQSDLLKRIPHDNAQFVT